MLWEDLAGPPKREKPEAGFYSRSSVYRLDLQEVTKVVQSRIGLFKHERKCSGIPRIELDRILIVIDAVLITLLCCSISH